MTVPIGEGDTGDTRRIVWYRLDERRVW